MKTKSIFNRKNIRNQQIHTTSKHENNGTTTQNSPLLLMKTKIILNNKNIRNHKTHPTQKYENNCTKTQNMRF